LECCNTLLEVSGAVGIFEALSSALNVEFAAMSGKSRSILFDGGLLTPWGKRLWKEEKMRRRRIKKNGAQSGETSQEGERKNYAIDTISGSTSDY